VLTTNSMWPISAMTLFVEQGAPCLLYSSSGGMLPVVTSYQHDAPSAVLDLSHFFHKISIREINNSEALLLLDLYLRAILRLLSTNCKPMKHAVRTLSACRDLQ
jgi:hypothetical protein